MNCEKTVLHDDILISSPVILAKCLPNPWVKSIQMKGHAHFEVEIIAMFYQSDTNCSNFKRDNKNLLTFH